MTPRALVVFLLLLLPAGSRAAATAADTLSFELPSKGWFVGWGGAPKETHFIDSTTVHGGRYAARMERDAHSASSFSTATSSIPITFKGETIELRGWLRTRDVSGGWAGLWMRLDSDAQAALQFDNMKDTGITGTTEWQEYRISFPLDVRATTVTFGAMVVGQGVIWADDLTFFVDGKPMAEAPALIRVEDTVEKDHEFDRGSRVDVTSVSKAQVKNLALLGRVWGFTKYHHPRATAGEVSWDYELFRVLPGVLAAKNPREAQTALMSWLDRVGTPMPCTSCAALPDTIQLQSRIQWIRDEKMLGKSLAKQLKLIYDNRPADGTQYHVSFLEAKNPRFDERAYAQRGFPDPGYRLLSLFRYWNIIEYWYPNRELIDENWNGVLEEFIPIVLQAADRRAYVLAMQQLAVRIDDGHSGVRESRDFMPPEGEGRLPASLRYVEKKFVVTALLDSLAAGEGDLQIGDALFSLDGQTIDGVATAIAPFYSSSNDEGLHRNMSFGLTSGVVGACPVLVERGGKRVTIASQRKEIDAMTAWRASIHDLPGATFQKLSNDVAYIKLSNVKADDCTSYIEQAKDTRCLIIDIRNYPSDFVPFALGGHLVDKPTPFAMFTRGVGSNPGTFVWTPAISVEPIVPRYAGKVAVLVDEASISQSEYTAMAFRASGAVIVGSTTAGADGNVSTIPLPGGLHANISGIGVFYPDRKPTQQVGIVPDVVVRPTIKGIRDGHDEVAEAAVKHLIGVDLRIPMR